MGGKLKYSQRKRRLGALPYGDDFRGKFTSMQIGPRINDPLERYHIEIFDTMEISKVKNGSLLQGRKEDLKINQKHHVP